MAETLVMMAKLQGEMSLRFVSLSCSSSIFSTSLTQRRDAKTPGRKTANNDTLRIVTV